MHMHVPTTSLPTTPTLASLGITSDVEQLYRELLAGTRELTVGEQHAVADHGLARWDDGRCVPVSIDLVWTTWQARRAQDQAAAQAAVGAFIPLYEQYLARDESRSFVEVLRGADAVHRKTTELFANTRASIDELIRAPFYEGPVVHMPPEQASLPANVVVRGLYEASLLAHQHVLDAVRESVAHGEDARVCPDAPLRMRIFDGTWAIVTLTLPPSDAAGMVTPGIDGLLITRSPFLDALVRLFETFWNQATPLRFDTKTDQAEGRLLAYMEAGLTDAAIGMSLGISERTVHRRISALMAHYGASTRFQLGMAAARRG